MKLESTSWLTVARVAKTLGVCDTTIRRLIKSGYIEAVRIGHGWRIPPGALERLRDAARMK